MLDTLITSKTRLKLLLKFFLNADTRAYLRNLESEFGESTNAIRIELNRFKEAGMLTSDMDGNKKVYQANKSHPLFENLHGLMLKYVGLDKIVENIIHRLGDIEAVYLVGDYAKGRDSGIVDLLIIAPKLDFEYLINLIKKAEKQIDRKIRYLHYKKLDEINIPLKEQANLLLWQK